MNWKLIFQLSLFGLIMACGTVSLIPEKTEWIYWLVIFIFVAYVIAKKCTANYFLYGFLVSMVNSIWITAAHFFLYKTFIKNHADMETMGAKMHLLANHPRELMLILGPVFGAMFGIVLGLFAFIASKIVKTKAPGVEV